MTGRPRARATDRTTATLPIRATTGRKRVTMTDVARRAGCSQSTVSMVLGGSGAVRISAEMRRRVGEAVAALGYRHAPSPRALPAPRPDHGARKPDPDHLAAAPRKGRSRTARVANEIGRRIVGGRYPENAILPGDAELMQEFAVSRTVLREALKTLSGKNLVEAKSRIGTRVRMRFEWQLFDSDVLTWHAEVGFDTAFLASLGEMRLLFEPEAAAMAAERRQPDQLLEIYTWVDRMAAAADSRADFVDADLNFHLEVAKIAKNPFLRSLSTLIRVALVTALTRSSPADEAGGVARSAAAHRRIADAIAAGDPDTARLAMRSVILEGNQRAVT